MKKPSTSFHKTSAHVNSIDTAPDSLMTYLPNTSRFQTNDNEQMSTDIERRVNFDEVKLKTAREFRYKDSPMAKYTP